MHNYILIAKTLRESATIAIAAERLGMTYAALASVAYRLRKRYPASFPARKGGRPPIVLEEVPDAPDQG